MLATSTPVYGNYHGYYSKRPAVDDPRLAILPKDLFEGAKVLDVGCNEGWVTCEIAQRLGAHKVIGVDIDETLVNAAWRRRRAIWSRQGPNGEPDYFPESCEHEFGSLPIPSGSSEQRGKHVFPHNVVFRTADWVAEEEQDEEGIGEVCDYDVVIAFSLSKWVHLNGGDEGIEKFFRRVHSVLRRGGTFVLEPQPWETYAKAKRMSEKLKENAKKLKLRPDDFPDLLQTIGFSPPQRLGFVGEGGFRRPVESYIKL